MMFSRLVNRRISKSIYSKRSHLHPARSLQECLRAYLHASSSLQSISPLRMPALSPTMESGQITSWKVQTGDRFSAGDILLTVETDKAEVDVEAQDDGYMGPKLFGPGSNDVKTKTIKVGQLIAVLGDEAGDIQGQVDIPQNWSSGLDSKRTNSANATENGKTLPASKTNHLLQQSQASASMSHPSKGILPLSPAVSRLFTEYGLKDTTQIRGTGLHGRITKGDVLAYLGKASSPSGTALKMIQGDAEARATERSKLNPCFSNAMAEQGPPMDGITFRQWITEGLSKLSDRTSNASLPLSFESILKDYPQASPSAKSSQSSSITSPQPIDKYYDGLHNF
ncbi:hypothetical protein O181_028545 [Austropuccinia psidii MF-1]|uniref:Uncharacterized protein n=1 Tax=Austropuccinia psidii MF-1 TaxID=1389203 RepID=A0A9Q3H4A7_9BASI|nr:hypothetical protein [Austropuccinia psidii MF-1]